MLLFCNVGCSVHADNYHVHISSYSKNIEKINEEYYVIYGKDTSACSFHFFTDARKDVVMDIVVCASAKIYEEDYGMDKYIVPQEERLIKEMTACISMFKERHRQCPIQHIYFMLSDFENTAIETTKCFSQRKGEDIYECIEKAMDKTDFKMHINNLLKRVSLKISSIKCFGCVLMVNKKYIIKQKRIQDKVNIPSNVIDVDVSLSLTEI